MRTVIAISLRYSGSDTAPIQQFTSYATLRTHAPIERYIQTPSRRAHTAHATHAVVTPLYDRAFASCPAGRAIRHGRYGRKRRHSYLTLAQPSFSRAPTCHTRCMRLQQILRLLSAFRCHISRSRKERPYGHTVPHFMPGFAFTAAPTIAVRRCLARDAARRPFTDSTQHIIRSTLYYVNIIELRVRHIAMIFSFSRLEAATTFKRK